MSHEHLSQSLRRIAASGTTAMTDRATALREAGRDIISLSVGEPDFDTPAHVLDAAKVALDTGHTKYTPVTGTLALKRAAASTCSGVSKSGSPTDSEITSRPASRSAVARSVIAVVPDAAMRRSDWLRCSWLMQSTSQRSGRVARCR